MGKGWQKFQMKLGQHEKKKKLKKMLLETQIALFSSAFIFLCKYESIHFLLSASFKFLQKKIKSYSKQSNTKLQISQWENTIQYHINLASKILQFSSVQFSRSIVSDSLRPHESQHARPRCSSPTRRVHPGSRPSSQ